MRLAVLGSAESWYFRDLERAAGPGEELLSATHRDLASHIGDRGQPALCGGVDLSACDAVLVRTMPPGSLEQVVFRMDVLGRLEAAGALVVNPPRAIEVAVDKYLATAKLRAAGLVVPTTFVCQTVDQAMVAFTQLGSSVVLKPLFGAEGRGIARLDDEALLHRAASLLVGMGAVLYLQQFIEHEGVDYRLLVIGRRVLGIRRVSRHDWRTNISRGAIAEPLRVTEQLADLALRAADAVGAWIAGVDLLPAKDGRLYALEVNAVPGWRALAAALDVDVARAILDDVACRRAAGTGRQGP